MLSFATEALSLEDSAAGLGENGLAASGLNKLDSVEVVAPDKPGVEDVFGGNVDLAPGVLNGAKRLEVAGAAFGVNIVEALDGARDGVDLVGEAGTGNLPNGLILGVSSFGSGRGAVFFSGLNLVGLLGFDGEGLSSIFLKMFEVLDPTELPFNLGVLICLSGLASSVSLVICDSAFLLFFIGEGVVRFDDGFPC